MVKRFWLLLLVLCWELISEINCLTTVTIKTKEEQTTNHHQLTQKVSIVLIRQKLQVLHDQHQVLKEVVFLETAEVVRVDLVGFLEADK